MGEPGRPKPRGVELLLPELKQAFPRQLGDVDSERFYRAINKVQPGLIRVEADELTYGLHVVLRFELEQEMLSGALALDELPDAWNARMKSYLGVDVPDAASGVLQDVHWSLGYVGYFPTYVIGSIVSAQIWEKAVEAMPGLEGQFEQGDFLPLREWLREHLHRHGRKFTPKETLQKVTGTDAVEVGPYVNVPHREVHRDLRLVAVLSGVGSSDPTNRNVSCLSDPTAEKSEVAAGLRPAHSPGRV